MFDGSGRVLSYITIGANDVARSGRFYAAILTPLGYETKQVADAFEFIPRDVPDRVNALGAVYVRKPYDGQAAAVGNGSMAAFQAGTREAVRTLHAAGVAAGGVDDGAPGFRDAYGERFYVGYLRDPLGNKIALFCVTPAQETGGR